MISPAMKHLGEALRHIRMEGVFYCPSTLTEPWGLSLPPMVNCLWFHLITAGACTFMADDGTQSSLRAGELVLIPHGAGHRAWGAVEAPTPSVLDLPHDELSETFGVLRHGGGGTKTELICGGVRFTHPASRRLLHALPPLVHIDTNRMPRGEWIRDTFELIGQEAKNARPGSDAVISRLCDIIVIQAVRAWVEDDPDARKGWLGALRDPQVGAAIAKIHADPAHDWTVAALAETASMSRSAFSARFTDLVAETPMRYITAYRMHLAHEILTTTDATVAVAGRQVGYESEAAFSRAFTRELGVSPSKARDAESQSAASSALS